MKTSLGRFECEIPPRVRSELLKKSRVRRRTIAGWVLPAGLLVGLGALMTIIGPPVKPPAPAAPAPTPKLPSEIWLEHAPAPAPRAVRVWPIGTYHAAILPDGTNVWLRCLGEKRNFSELPANPSIGDCWSIPSSKAAWVWAVPAGWNKPAWVDP